MAVIQISRIQHRRGLADDLPDALAEGELGFAIDTGELFIGAPTNDLVANRTAYPYKNIKVLTEFDVQRSITGDVYHNGPLKKTEVALYTTPQIILTDAGMTKVPLFKLSQATYGIYDFSLSEIPAYDADATVQSGNALHCGSISLAAGLPAAEITVGLGQSSAVNGGISVVSGAPSQLTGGSPAVPSTGKVAILATCEADGDDYQVFLLIANRTTTRLMFHFSGREWLAVSQF